MTLPFCPCRALRPRRILRRPSPLSAAYCCLPDFRPCRHPDIRVTRLNRFTCVTAWTSLCLRLTHVVTFMSPRLDSRWGGSSLSGAGISPAESAGLSLAHRKILGYRRPEYSSPSSSGAHTTTRPALGAGCDPDENHRRSRESPPRRSG